MREYSEDYQRFQIHVQLIRCSAHVIDQKAIGREGGGHKRIF